MTRWHSWRPSRCLAYAPRMTKISTVFALSIALAACGGKDGGSTTTTPTTAKADMQFELGEMTVLEGTQAMIKIHADGSTEIGSRSGTMELKPGQPASSDSLPVSFKPGPMIKTDGTFEWQGKAVARVNSDGTVTNLENNQPAQVTLTADQVTMPEGTIALAADGKLTVAGPHATTPSADKQMHAEGADTAGKRRTVLALVALMLHGEQKVTVDTTNASVPAALAPAPAH
jgi:hypothetical protein